MDKQPVGQLSDLTQSNNDDEIMVITNSEYNQLKKEKISDFITDLTSTDADNSLVKGDDGKLFVSKTINASDVDGVLSLDNIPQLSTNKLPETGISADNYSYPSSITVNDRGQVVSIVEGSAAEAGAYLDQSQITNCILEIPQNIPVPTFSNKTLTFNDSLTVIVPYGKSAPTLEIGDSLNNGVITDISWDGTKLFYYVTYGTKTYSKNKPDNSDEYIIVNPEGNCSGLPLTSAVSSDTAPAEGLSSNFAIWYDTANNIVKWTSDNASTWINYHSVPFAIITFSGSGTSYDIADVKTIMNGVHCLGSSFFVDKGVKVLCSNGRNPDGTLNNVEVEFTDVGVYTQTDNLTGEYWVQASGSNFVGRLLKTWWKYDFVNNYIVSGNGEIARTTMVGEFSISSGKITSFKPYNTFHAIDYNEAVKRSGDTMYGDLTLENSQLTVKGAYPAYYGKNTNIAISETTAPSSSQFFLQLRGDDMNGEYVGVTQYYQNANNTFMGQNVIRRKVNNAYEECRLDLMIKNNGTRTANIQSDNITHNGTTIRYVKQSYINGTSWYRVWSDGWIEQGGRAVSFNTVTLPKTFKNTNYTLQMQIISGEYCMGVTVSSINTNSFYFGTATHGGVHEDKPNVTCMWYACGF